MRTMTYKMVLLLIATLATPLALGQVCKDDIDESTPDSRFSVSVDGTTVTDDRTGLIWMRCSLGQTWENDSCSGSATVYSWWDALKAAESHDFAAFEDWRLPNIKELFSLAERACHQPSINATIFPATASAGYWSSSPYVGNSQAVWNVGFGSGKADFSSKNQDYAVRLVRGGQ